MVLSPTRSKAHQRELYGWLISLGLQRWNALLPESARACQYYFELSWPRTIWNGQGAAGGKIGVQKTARPTKSARVRVCR